MELYDKIGKTLGYVKCSRALISEDKKYVQKSITIYNNKEQYFKVLGNLCKLRGKDQFQRMLMKPDNIILQGEQPKIWSE